MIGFIKLCESPWFTENATLLQPYAQHFQAQWFGRAANGKTVEKDELNIV